MASVSANRVRFLVSLASELSSQANRVRDLIGDSHWLVDGHHKEFLLIELIQRHLPAGMIAARGFVIDPGEEGVCSREQDVLIIDTTSEAPLFRQSGVVIALPRAVRAAVSVKTTCKKETVIDTVLNLNSLRSVIARHVSARAVWCGGYYFEPGSTVVNDPMKPLEYIEAGVREHPVPTVDAIDPQPSPQGPDLHCTGRDFGYRMTHAYRDGSPRVVPGAIHGYRCGGMATALFIGSLLSHLSRSRGEADADFTTFADGQEFELLGGRELTPAAG